MILQDLYKPYGISVNFQNPLFDKVKVAGKMVENVGVGEEEKVLKGGLKNPEGFCRIFTNFMGFRSIIRIPFSTR